MNLAAQPVPEEPVDAASSTPGSRPAKSGVGSSRPSSVPRADPSEHWPEVADDDDEYEPL